MGDASLQDTAARRIVSRAHSFRARGRCVANGDALVEHLPTLWYPRCASCGQKATPRAGLGDHTGPHPVPHDTVTCASCGQTTVIDERTVWLKEPLEAA